MAHCHRDFTRADTCCRAATFLFGHIAERNHAFDANRKNLGQIAYLRKEVSAREAQINLLTGAANQSEIEREKELLGVLQQMAGVWNVGGLIYHLFGGTASLKYTSQSENGTTSEDGSCTVSGNVATCNSTRRYNDPNYHFSADEAGRSTLTLSGDESMEIAS